MDEQPVTTFLHPAIVAIDGPAASGKSTVGYELARRLNFLFFDTGVMYRAVTWAVLHRRADIDDEAAVGHLAETVPIEIEPPLPDVPDGRQCTVLVDNLDVTWLIRTPVVDQNVSAVAAYARVRAALSVQQRRIGQRYGAGHADLPGIVMVGRDIGTVVMPDAPLKVYMDATAEERARRRYAELLTQGKSVDYNQVLDGIIARDRKDSERALSPLRVADDAVVIDSTNLSPEQVLARILELITGQDRRLAT